MSYLRQKIPPVTYRYFLFGYLCAINFLVLSCHSDDLAKLNSFNDHYLLSSKMQQYFSAQQFRYFESPESRRWLYYVREYYPKKTANLRADHLAAIRAYTSSDSLYREVNRSLVSGDQLKVAQHRPLIDNLNEAISLMPEDDQLLETVLFRRLPDKLIEEFSLYTPNDIMRSPAYFSTSVNDYNLLDGDERSLVIRLEPSEYNLLGRNIAELSAYPGEGEVLFPPGMVVKFQDKLTQNKVVIGGEQYLEFTIPAQIIHPKDCK